MTKKENKKPVLEHEKQHQPLAGETSPEEAFYKAKVFVELEKKHLESINGVGVQLFLILAIKVL